ncbi:nad(p)h nitroreductase ydgi-related [Anaeramoeba flamelloides]|uniref:Nad(P)h nitroreductase ydgi-related n=1 Tax=Anaeramoeba flamelloides TaxID=1746091 RepID=A0AAV7YNW7_9EUKA|nr:nad(p)h nitroreductase ydgi-related [Anaeramoeba flamelloides]KAJ6235712.1 nad(p)h nitroreductase ydgi-related [Anaeramoeba flamelloides]
MLNLLKTIPKANIFSSNLQRSFSNSVFDCIKSRRSCRGFDPKKKVKRSDIEEILHVAKHSPTAMHSQPWKVKITTDAPMLRRIGTTIFEKIKKDKQFRGFCQMVKNNTASEPIFYDAPLAMFIYSDLKRARSFEGALDIGIFVGNILNGLESKGLGGIPVGIIKYDLPTVESEITTGENEKFIVAIGCGYTSKDFKPSKKNLRTDDIEWLD